MTGLASHHPLSGCMLAAISPRAFPQSPQKNCLECHGIGAALVYLWRDNINDLKAIYAKNKIWDANYIDYLKRLGLDANDGSMGRIYGTQWRRWRGADGEETDQLAEAITLIKNNPDSRRILVNAWNAAEAGGDTAALPPCHTFFQFYVASGRLSLQMYQRSADMFLGVPLPRLRALVAHGCIRL